MRFQLPARRSYCGSVCMGSWVMNFECQADSLCHNFSVFHEHRPGRETASSTDFRASSIARFK
jgi:hypothetical protein